MSFLSTLYKFDSKVNYALNLPAGPLWPDWRQFNSHARVLKETVNEINMAGYFFNVCQWVSMALLCHLGFEIFFFSFIPLTLPFFPLLPRTQREVTFSPVFVHSNSGWSPVLHMHSVRDELNEGHSLCVVKTSCLWSVLWTTKLTPAINQTSTSVCLAKENKVIQKNLLPLFTVVTLVFSGTLRMWPGIKTPGSWNVMCSAVTLQPKPSPQACMRSAPGWVFEPEDGGCEPEATVDSELMLMWFSGRFSL